MREKRKKNYLILLLNDFHPNKIISFFHYNENRLFYSFIDQPNKKELKEKKKIFYRDYKTWYFELVGGICYVNKYAKMIMFLPIQMSTQLLIINGNSNRSHQQRHILKALFLFSRSVNNLALSVNLFTCASIIFYYISIYILCLRLVLFFQILQNANGDAVSRLTL